MHESVMAWVGERVREIGLTASDVLEVGSCDVNGSVRPLFRGASDYVGVDISPGPGVDVVLQTPIRLPFVDCRFSVVVSTEMLEHAEFPALVVAEMFRVLRPGGLLLLTTRSEGFGYHNPPDYHRFSVAQIMDLLKWSGFGRATVRPDPQVPGVFAIAYRL
jgi:SAM-dependent methyltransferase